MRKGTELLDYICINKHTHRNYIVISIPNILYKLLDSPKRINFNEYKNCFSSYTLEDNGSKAVSHNNSGSGVSLSTILHTKDVEEYIGKWSYEINDLTVNLLEKQQ